MVLTKEIIGSFISPLYEIIVFVNFENVKFRMNKDLRRPDSRTGTSRNGKIF